MKIMIHREGKEYGPYSLEEARDLLAQGVLSAEDLAWKEGGDDWVRLKDLLSGPPPGPLDYLAPAPSPRAQDPSPVLHPWSAKLVGIGVVVLVLLVGLSIYSIAKLVDTLGPLFSLMDVKSSPTALTPTVASNQPIEFKEGAWITLPSGKQIKILSAQEEEDEDHQVYCLHYVSLVDNIHEFNQAAPEVDSIWPLFKAQAEASGLDRAEICPTKVISTFPIEETEYEIYHFNKTDGVWAPVRAP